MSATNELDRVRALVEPIADDLDLDLYDVERRGPTVRVTLDTRPGSDGGITLDTLALATRLISREIDHEDPIATKFTLEVTSPGLERALRTPAHFQREVGKTITVRFRDPGADPRRIDGDLVAADDAAATLRLADDTQIDVPYDAIDKARTVFEWGPKPKPGGPKSTENTGKNSGKNSGKNPGKNSGKNTSGTTPGTKNGTRQGTNQRDTGADDAAAEHSTTDNKEKQTS